MTTSLVEKGKQATDQVILACPETLPTMGYFKTCKRVSRTPLVVAPLFKNKEISIMDWSVLRPKNIYFFWQRVRGHFGFKSTEQFCQVFLCLPSSLSLNFQKKGKKEVQLKKKKMYVWGEGETTCQSSYMRTFQLMLTTYLYVAHSTILFRTPQKPSLLSLKNFKRKTKRKKKTSSIQILQTSKHPRALAKECSGAFPL